MELELKELSGQVIGACIAVHRELGPGFLESVYENALQVELRRRQIPAGFQKEVCIQYAGEVVGVHQLDLLVAEQLVVELKAVRELAGIHFSQVRSYLRATGLTHGLLVNFSTMPLTIRRVICDGI
ncbi:MAG: GxxExxY protein [Planctomycetaceae bacterium]|nr:GxxExxY protein [Planctomycetaceae bacterium]